MTPQRHPPGAAQHAAPSTGLPALPPATILVWDLPVRLFHGLLALCFAGAWLSAESERWRLLHTTLGYTVGGLVAFRLVWGLVGTRHARFSDFVRGPQAVLRYLQALLRGRPQHHVGHNPAGALAIVALLGLGGLTALTGWAGDSGLADGWVIGDRLMDLHEGAASSMLALVGLHIAGVLVASRLHRDKLAAAMLTGRKQGPAGQAIRSTRPAVAVLLLAAVLGFWAWQWHSAAAPLPAPLVAGTAAVAVTTAGQPQPPDQHR